MKISIIGTGNVGSALAQGWLNAGHEVAFGVRDPKQAKSKNIALNHIIPFITVTESAQWADVIVVSATPTAVKEIAAALGDVSKKILIDTMNSVRTKPEPYSNTTEALMKLTNCNAIVKCFNTTGSENMGNPTYGNSGIDMFMAGDSALAKDTAQQLALDLGFEKVYNFGGSDKFNLLEQFALSWINLAMMQGYGRNFAFKIVHR